MSLGPAAERVGLGPWSEGQSQALRDERLAVSCGDRRPGLSGLAGSRIGLTIIAIDGIREPGRRVARVEKGLVGVVGRAIVHDVEVEIAVLIEVEPAGHERKSGRCRRA